MVTIFNDLFITDTPFFKDIDDVLATIKNNPNKDAILKIRSVKDKEKRNKLKQKLKCVCFSGEFSKRKAINIVKHSGFVCLDFDDVGTLEDAGILRDSLSGNEYVYSAFISPSGNGVKAIVPVPAEINNHKKYYEALCETFDTDLDEKTKDVARVCYESYDPELFINHDAKQWVLKKEFTEITRVNNYPEYFKISEQDRKVQVILKWFDKKFAMRVGERNTNLFKLGCGLNRAGLPKDEAINLFKNYYSTGLKETELESIANSAYKNTTEFNSLTLIDDTKVNKFHEVLKKGDQKARRMLRKEGLDNDAIDDVLDFDYEEDFLIFWDSDKKGKISLNDFKFRLFLENRGFYKVQLNEKEFTFVKVYNNIINEISETAIKDFVLQHVEGIDINVYNFFARSTGKFTETYLNQLATRELTMLRDKENVSYLFFENTIVEVTPKGIKYIDYLECGGLVWKKNIIPHNFIYTKKKTDFEQFILNVSNQDPTRKNILEISIGYLLTTYKKQNEGLAIVLYDETLNDNPSGRTGKTLISKALGQIRKVSTLNGKEFNNKGQFPYQTVNLDDNILCFDDLDRKFMLEGLFSIITGDLTLNKKNLQPIVIPYHNSPKILFTSNYILSGTGDSHEARKVEIELYRHYSSNYEPINEFGKLFFGRSWTTEDWCAFFSYMIENIQSYFNQGIIKPELGTGKTRKMISNTSEDFFEFCENEMDWHEEEYFRARDIYKSYSDGVREVPRNMNLNWFGRWISQYIEYKEWKREDVNNGGVRKFKILNLPEKENELDEVEF
jgi:hypothetical protein